MKNALKFVSVATNNPLKIRLKPIAYERDEQSSFNVDPPSPMAIKEYRRRSYFGKGYKLS
ncbi:hypothetical protein SAMD00019534_125900, partial [Acytostelium subglobosum LB1]|uniref:hypothetical protein n=1 Tax=Acytostelium subglobosum LB1 TaxID=1410327 RepID=UPI000644B928